jgi:hypothetical protein
LNKIKEFTERREVVVWVVAPKMIMNKKFMDYVMVKMKRDKKLME